MSQRACGPVFAGTALSINGTSWLSPTTRAFYAFGRDSARSVGYLLLVRGQPLPAGGGGGYSIGGRMDGSEPREHTWRPGGRPFTVHYDPGEAALTIAGAQISLDTANVVLLEYSEAAPSGLVIHGAVCAPPLRPDSLAADLWERVPATRAYVTVPGGT